MTTVISLVSRPAHREEGSAHVRGVTPSDPNSSYLASAAHLDDELGLGVKTCCTCTHVLTCARQGMQHGVQPCSNACSTLCNQWSNGAKHQRTSVCHEA
jgi:hypothetical protein